MRRNIAIILAGGMGSRVGGNTPKQMLPLEDGRTVLEHAVDAFELAPAIDEIAIVMHPEWMDEAKQICERNEWRKVAKIIPGGAERWESSWHAILAYMDVNNQLSEIRNKQIGFIFQGFNLISSLTAQANVELPLVYRGMRAEESHRLSLEALEKVGLSHRLTHLPKQMSGGQQQRVAIARAVAARPPIILADEPTGNLDSHSGEDVIQILTELYKEGRTVIIITHDNSIAQRAKRVIRISDGQIVDDYINENVE